MGFESWKKKIKLEKNPRSKTSAFIVCWFYLIMSADSPITYQKYFITYIWKEQNTIFKKWVSTLLHKHLQLLTQNYTCFGNVLTWSKLFLIVHNLLCWLCWLCWMGIVDTHNMQRWDRQPSYQSTVIWGALVAIGSLYRWEEDLLWVDTVRKTEWRNKFSYMIWQTQ